MRNNYGAWEISEKDFPKKSNTEERFKFFLRYGILAPSTHNTQPWKFQILKNAVTIFPDWNLCLPQADPDDSNLFFSLGCCTQNIIIAAAKFGYETKVSIDEQKNNAKITLQFTKTKKTDKNLTKLFQSLTKRYSNKLMYKNKKIDKEKFGQFKKISKDGAKILLNDNQKVIKEIAQNHVEAASKYAYNKKFAQELSMWMRPNNTKAGDGMPGFVVGQKNILSFFGKHIIKQFPQIMKVLAKKDKQLILSSSAVGIVATTDDDIKSWVHSGMAYEKLSLTAIGLGVNTTMMAAMVEDKFFKKELGKIFKNDNLTPQMFFRIGFASNEPYHTPRRSLEKALI